MEALRYKPIAYYMLDDSPNFQDYSGYNNGSNSGGTEARGVSLSSYAKFSQRFGGGTYVGFFSPLYNKGKENKPFSLSAIVYPIITVDGPDMCQIVSHVDDFDGIYMSGTTIYFSTAYTYTGDATCSYDMGDIQKANIVGVHTETKNSLYVNGVLVDEVDITAEQQADIYKNATNALFATGYQTSNQSMLVNAIGFFGTPLQEEDVRRMYEADNRVPPGTPGKALGGDEVVLGTAARHAYLDTGWFTDEDWSDASLYNVVTDGDQLYSTKENGLTLGGIWIDTVDIYNSNVPDLINSMVMSWQGTGETVQVSLDGVTWETVINGRNLTTIPLNLDPIGKSLSIRVTFTEGLQEAYIKDLSIRGYIGDTTISSGRTITYTDAVVFDDTEPHLMKTDSGVTIRGGTVLIGPDESDPITNTYTVEFWVRLLPGGVNLTGADITSAEIYLNGEPYVSGLGFSEWCLIHWIITPGGNNAMDFTGNCELGKVVLYDRPLTASEIKSIYNNYIGYDKVTYSSGGSIGLSEPATPAVVYAHDWEITAT